MYMKEFENSTVCSKSRQVKSSQVKSSQVSQQNFHECCEQATQRCVFQVFYPKFSVYIKESNNICEFSLYIQCLFFDVMKRFNKIANIEGNRVNISAMRTTTTNLWLL